MDPAQLKDGFPLGLAAWRNAASLVGKLVAQGASVDMRVSFAAAPSPPSDPLLQLRWGQTMAEDPLQGLSKSSDRNLDWFGVENGTPLFAAVANDSVEAAEVLLRSGASAEVHDDTWRTPLRLALDLGNKRCAELLRQRGAPLELVPSPAEALVRSIERGDVEAVEAALRAGASPNATDTRLRTLGASPLMLAVRSGVPEIMIVLLDAGAVVEQRVPVRDWPLHLASTVGAGPTALAEAAAEDSSEAIDLLVERGARVDALEIGFASGSELMIAARAGAASAVRSLLAHGADPNRRDWGGETALDWSAGVRYATSALLFEACGGCDDSEIASWLLNRAIRCGDTEALQRFLDLGARPRRQDLYGKVPMKHPKATPEMKKQMRDAERAHRARKKAAKPDEGARRPSLLTRRPKIDQYTKTAVRARWKEAWKASGLAAAVQALEALGVAMLPKGRGAGPVGFTVPAGTEVTHGQLAEVGMTHGVICVASAYEQSTSGERHVVCGLLAPTTDALDLIAMVRPTGPNQGAHAKKVLRFMAALRNECPFRLTDIRDDLIAGELDSGPPDPLGLAKDFYEICPDMVEQGTGTIERLAEGLRTERIFYCWWD